MYDRILVPLDGSALAEEALPHAKEMARKFGAAIVLFQAVMPLAEIAAGNADDSPAPETAESIERAGRQLAAMTAEGRRYLDSVAAQLQQEGIGTSTWLAEGRPASAILECAKEHAVALIAMSTHGRGGLGRLVFGSVADAVLRNSHLPILLVRSQG